MLTGVHQDMLDGPVGMCIVVFLNGSHQGGYLHEVGAGTDDGEEFHK